MQRLSFASQNTSKDESEAGWCPDNLDKNRHQDLVPCKFSLRWESLWNIFKDLWNATKRNLKLVWVAFYFYNERFHCKKALTLKRTIRKQTHNSSSSC